MNNHIKIAYPKPFILFSVDRAILYDNATKIKFRNVPTINNSVKSNISVDLKSPYITKGIPNPKTKLKVSEREIPMY